MDNTPWASAMGHVNTQDVCEQGKKELVRQRFHEWEQRAEGTERDLFISNRKI